MATPSPSPGDDLVAILKQAQRASAARPFFYALVVKAPAGGRLIVSRRKIPPKQVADARKDVGSNVVVKGVCYAGEGGLVFESALAPQPNWQKAAKQLAKDAGFNLHASFVQGRDDEAVAEDGDEEPPPTAAPVAPSPVASADQDEQAAFAARLKALMPRVTAAAAVPATAQAAGLARARLSEAGLLVRQAKAADVWTRAGTLLDDAEALLRAAPAAMPTPAPDAGQTGDPLADCTHQLTALLPAIKAANAPALLQQARDAAALVQQKDVEGARRAIAMLRQALAAPSAGVESWRQAHREWLAANEALDAQLNALRAAILGHAKSEPALAGVLGQIAEVGLNALTGNHRVRLSAALQGLAAGDATTLRQQGAKAREAIAAFKAALDANDQVDACEGNPWDVEVAIRDTLYPPLDRLTEVLAAHPAA